jgi:hypothetical protein
VKYIDILKYSLVFQENSDGLALSRDLDGWSSLVMIPVSHTGGREFESLPIHLT